MPTYTLTLLPDSVAICRLPADADIPPWAMSALAVGGFGAITRTRDELSVVCTQRYVPTPTPSNVDANADANADAQDSARSDSDAPDGDAPNLGLRVDADWRTFHVQGPFAFTEIGVLAALTTALANANIGLFAISTFDTDYLLVKAANVDKAIQALTMAGHIVEGHGAA